MPSVLSRVMRATTLHETIAVREAVHVKGFGCRPLAAVRRAPAAGVRKPPRKETAMGEGAAVPRALW